MSLKLGAGLATQAGAVAKVLKSHSSSGCEATSSALMLRRAMERVRISRQGMMLAALRDSCTVNVAAVKMKLLYHVVKTH
jgi:hypothetical protein